MTDYVNHLAFTVSAAPGLGAIPVGAALSGHVTFGAAHDGRTFSVTIEDGDAREVRTGCVYSHSTLTLTRGALESSTSGAALNLSAAAVARATITASELFSATRQVGGIASSQYVMLGDSQTMNHGGPVSASAVSYNNLTGALTVTFALHGLATGSIIRLAVRAAPQWNGYDYLATRIDANTFSIPCTAGLGVAPATADVRWSPRGAAQRPGIYGDVQSITGGRVQMVREAGMTGETWGQIRARIAAEVAPMLKAGGTVVLQGGHNDALGGVVTAAQSIASMQGAVADLQALGLRVILLTCTPFGVGFATTAARVHILEQNRAIRAMAKPGSVAIADAFAVVNDPASQCNALTNYVLSDGLHWSGKGSRAIANLVAGVFNTWFPALQRLPLSHLDCYHLTNNPGSTNVMSNALFATQTGGVVNNAITGVMPSQVEVATDHGSGASFTASCPAASWGVGNSAKVAWSSLTFANNLVRIYSASQHARLAPGQRVRFACRVKTTGLAGGTLINYICAYVYITVDGVAITLPVFNLYGSPAAGNDQTDWDGIFESDVIPIPAGSALTNFQWQVGAYLNGTCAGSLEVGQIDITVVS